jgi:hypothetical protein
LLFFRQLEVCYLAHTSQHRINQNFAALYSAPVIQIAITEVLDPGCPFHRPIAIGGAGRTQDVPNDQVVKIPVWTVSIVNDSYLSIT